MRGAEQLPQFMRLGEAEWIEVLYASRNGWFSTHPIAYAGVLGLLFVPKKARIIALALFLAVVAQVYINSCVFDWWSGASFGQRRLCSLTFVLVFGLAALVRAAGILCKRLPPWSLHLLASLLFGWFLAWNLTQVHQHRKGKAANGTTHAMCCDRRVPKPMREIAKPVYDIVGNPFAWPASALFAARFNVPLRQWDDVAGNYADHPDLRLFNVGKHRSKQKGWNFPERYLTGGFARQQRDKKRTFRWTTNTEAGVIVPLFVTTEARTFTMWILPNGDYADIKITVNDVTYLTEKIVDGWTKVVFTVPSSGLQRGMNHLVIHSVLNEFDRKRSTIPGPPKHAAVGVAVSNLSMGYAKKAPIPTRTHR